MPSRGPNTGSVARHGGPLPVEYVDLIGWFYPAAGHGELRLSRLVDHGHGEPELVHELQRPLTPFYDDRDITWLARSWEHAVRRMTGWKHLAPPDSADSERA
jgi:hypothetical protein